MSILWIDFETRSRCDLRSRGVYNYAQDISTEVLCMSYAFDDDEVRTWTPDRPFPDGVWNHTGQIRAHNAAFERLVFWYVRGEKLFNVSQDPKVAKAKLLAEIEKCDVLCANCHRVHTYENRHWHTKRKGAL